MATIYESPDKGITIFSRQLTLSGLLNNSFIEDRYEGIDSSEFFEKMRQQREEEKLWRDIRHAAKENTVLKEILNQAIMLHTLSKED